MRTGKKFSDFIDTNYTEEEAHFLNFMWKKIRDTISDPIEPPIEMQIDYLGTFFISKTRIKKEIRKLIRKLRDPKVKDENIINNYKKRLNYLFKNRHNAK